MINAGKIDVPSMTYLDHGKECSRPHPKHEDEKENTVKGCEAFRVKHREQDQAGTGNHRAENGKHGEDFLPRAHVWWEPVHMPVSVRSASNKEAPNPYLAPRLNHRSTTRVATNPHAVIQQPTIKRGLRISAPMSDMYAIDPSMLTYLGRPWASQVMSIASSVPTHTNAVKRGIHT